MGEESLPEMDAGLPVREDSVSTLRQHRVVLVSWPQTKADELTALLPGGILPKRSQLPALS